MDKPVSEPTAPAEPAPTLEQVANSVYLLQGAVINLQRAVLALNAEINNLRFPLG